MKKKNKTLIGTDGNDELKPVLPNELEEPFESVTIIPVRTVKYTEKQLRQMDNCTVIKIKDIEK